MIESHKNKANFGIGVGIVLSITGRLWVNALAEEDPLALLALALQVVGYGLFIFGCVQYALAKGRSGFWGLLGCLSLIGLIVLVLLKDYGVQPRRPHGFAAAGQRVRY